MKDNLKVTFTGDALFVADFPKEYVDGDMKGVADYIGSGDVRITNLETNVSEFGDYASAYSGGTWINTEPEDFKYIEKFGFNYYGTANNHTLDYSYHGLLSTLEVLDKKGLAHSGSGKSLEEAGAPAILNANGKKVGIIAVTTSFNMAAKAGGATPKLKARPGVNYLSFDTYHQITKEQAETLNEIAKSTKMNAYNDLLIATGFSLPAPEGVLVFGTQKFCFDGSRKKTECNKADKARLINSIKDAKKVCDYVFVLIHCHEIGNTKHEEVPDFFVELSHACIDAGASAIMGGGTHQLRPLEIYKGLPIFYSLGDFIYQGMRVKYLPADFLNKYGCPATATALEGLNARSKGGKIGLQAEECNFLTVVPKIEYKDGKMISLEMIPTSLGFNKKGDENGLPYHAKGEEGEKIFNILSRLSKPYGTELKLDNDVIKLI